MFSTIVHRLRTKSETGATATEYGMLLAFLVMLTIFGISVYGNALVGIVTRLAGNVVSWYS